MKTDEKTGWLRRLLKVEKICAFVERPAVLRLLTDRDGKPSRLTVDGVSFYIPILLFLWLLGPVLFGEPTLYVVYFRLSALC